MEFKYRLHDSRHFYASELIAAGCDMVRALRAMGHKSALVTLHTYSHPQTLNRNEFLAGQQRRSGPDLPAIRRLNSSNMRW